jgi:hypothetical protein
MTKSRAMLRRNADGCTTIRCDRRQGGKAEPQSLNSEGLKYRSRYVEGVSLHVARSLSYSKAALGWVTTRPVPRDVLAAVSPAHDEALGTGILDAQLARHVVTLPSTTRTVTSN